MKGHNWGRSSESVSEFKAPASKPNKNYATVIILTLAALILAAVAIVVVINKLTG